MAEPARRVDLRLTIPGATPYDALAGELAAKFAEYTVADAAVARPLAREVDAVAKKKAGAADIAFTLEARDRDLMVTAVAGNRKEQIVVPL
jgi:hypothetical protein